jgi:hypothetical protein
MEGKKVASRTLTRKHFELIAGILAEFRMTLPTDEFLRLVDKFCEAFTAEFPLFDAMRFRLWVLDDREAPVLTGKIGKPVPAGSPTIPRAVIPTEEMSFRKLADQCVRASNTVPFDEEYFILIVNTIADRIDLPLGDTELGITPTAWNAIELFVNRHKTSSGSLRSEERGLFGVASGDRVECIDMLGAHDDKIVKRGEQGTVLEVGTCQVMVRWDDGRKLPLVTGVDTYEVCLTAEDDLEDDKWDYGSVPSMESE